MQKHKFVRVSAVVLLLVAFLSSSTNVFAKTVLQTDVLNNFQIGIVDIDLSEYQENDNKTETEFKNNLEVWPGGTVSKIPRIKNKGADAYIRVKVDINDSNIKSNKHLTADNISGWNKDLVKRGDYYYYTKVLKNAQSFDVFKKVSVPAQWDSEAAGQSFDIKISVDAIQAKNFSPNFDEKEPWGNVEIQKCIHENGYDFNTLKAASNQKLSVTLLDKATDLISSPKDFFVNLPYLMPGDAMTDKVTLRNNYTKPVNLYFGSIASKSGTVLDYMYAKIYFKPSGGSETLIYEGKLNTDMQYRLLATINAGQQGEMIFTISVPTTVDNKYALQKSNIKWLFMAEFEEDKPASVQTPILPTHIFKTGDTGLTPYLITMVISGIGLLYVLIASKKRKE